MTPFDLWQAVRAHNGIVKEEGLSFEQRKIFDALKPFKRDGKFKGTVDSALYCLRLAGFPIK